MLPPTHPLHKPVAQAARRFVKQHHSPLHELMHKYKLKPKLLENIVVARQGPKWEADVTIRIAANKEKAKEEDLADEAEIKVSRMGPVSRGELGWLQSYIGTGC
jgi:hypothetical protein